MGESPEIVEGLTLAACLRLPRPPLALGVLFSAHNKHCAGLSPTERKCQTKTGIWFHRLVPPGNSRKWVSLVTRYSFRHVFAFLSQMVSDCFSRMSTSRGDPDYCSIKKNNKEFVCEGGEGRGGDGGEEGGSGDGGAEGGRRGGGGGGRRQSESDASRHALF